MVIVGGVFSVDPAEREAFLAGRLDLMRTSRREPGCLEYTFSADPIEPGRVLLFERWESQEALDRHLAALKDGPRSDPGVVAESTSIVLYDVAGARSFGR